MEEFFRDFHFLRPWYLLLLFLPLLFYWKFFRGVRNKSSWEAVCDKRLLDFCLSGAVRRSAGRFHIWPLPVLSARSWH